MKIRIGFVSNSSSSSYLIYGTEVPSGTLKDLAQKEAEKYGDGMKIYYAWDGLRDLFLGTRVTIEGRNDDIYSSVYVGGDPRSMRGDETMDAFKAEIEKTIKEKLGNYCLPFGWHEDGWYNG